MAVVTLLFSYIARQTSNIVQAIFGWSITALFGKLPRRALIMVIGALLLSLAWPALVLGAFFPKVAAWAILFAPLHKAIGVAVLRGIWIALAVLAPIGVGLLVRAAAPGQKSAAVRAMVHGYPMAFGFFVGFVVIAVTVPIIKVASIVRGWSDEHVYVQPHDAQYDAVLRSLAEACARAGVVPEISDVPGHMQFATTIMRKFASGAVTPFVPAQLRRVTSDGVQLYLYPADLLLRGKPEKVARIRAMISRTDLDRSAYLVEAANAKHVQDELRRLNDQLRDRQAHGRTTHEILAARLREVFREMRNTDVTYAEWALLEAMARRLERRLVTATFPIDEVPDALPELAKAANTNATDQEVAMETTRTQPADSLDRMSTADLLGRTLTDAKQLVRSELALAKQDLRAEAKAAVRGAVELVLAYSCAVLMLASLVTSIALAIGHSMLALGFAIGFLVLGAVAAALGYKALPKHPLDATRTRVARDIDRLEEHMG